MSVVNSVQVSRREFLKTASFAGAAFAVSTSIVGPEEALLRAVTPAEAKATAEQEQVFNVISTCHAGGAGEPITVHLKAGKISWCEAFKLTEAEAKLATWSIAVGRNPEKVFRESALAEHSPQGMALKSRLYDPRRLRYPMKRLGYEPGGEGNVSNRGKGEFVRITHAEAYDLVAKEIKRLQEKYGPSGIAAWSCTHTNGGAMHQRAVFARFTNMMGGYTARVGLTGTWQHWDYAGSFTWGYQWQNGEADTFDLLGDTLQNSKLGIVWGVSPNDNEPPYGGHTAANYRFWMKEAGMRLISINPIYNDTAALWCDQWIPIIPGTDAALALAIANVWINEGTYDKNYVSTHTVGFEKFSDYVLGRKDGPDGKVARTPEWAAKITGVKAKIIRALAKEWASKPTALLCLDSGINRSSFGHEWCRLMILLQAMQGVGKPGVNIWPGSNKSVKGTPMPFDKTMPSSDYPGMEAVAKNKAPANPVRQTIQVQLAPESILTDFTKNPPLKWMGGTGCAGWSRPSAGKNYKPNDPFTEYQYPMAGYSEAHMLLRFGGSGGSGICINDCNGYARMMKSPKLETIVILAPYLEPEVLYSDIVFPASLELERNDIMGCVQCGRVALYSPKIIEPPGEAKTDYEMLAGITERLGFKDKYTDGNTEDDWMRKMYEASEIPKRSKLSWEQFKAKGYYAYEFPKDYKPAVGLRWYTEKPEGGGLETPSGKIEFQSKVITDFWGENSTAVGDVPKYFVTAYGRYSPTAKKYPLQVVAQHNKYRIHTKWNSAPHLTDVYKLKGNEPECIKGIGYEPVNINPADAQARGIKEKDIVRIFNDTGQILCYAHVTNRIVSGVIHVAWGAWYAPLQPGNPDSPDAGGEFNTLAPRSVGGLEQYVDASGSIKTQRPHCLATHGHGILAQMEKWKGY